MKDGDKVSGYDKHMAMIKFVADHSHRHESFLLTYGKWEIATHSVGVRDRYYWDEIVVEFLYYKDGKTVGGIKKYPISVIDAM